MDKKGNIVPDAHFIFTALPNADFMAESARHLALASVHFLLQSQTASADLFSCLFIAMTLQVLSASNAILLPGRHVRSFCRASGQLLRHCMVLCSDNTRKVEGSQVLRGRAFQERAPDAGSALHAVGPLFL